MKKITGLLLLLLVAVQARAELVIEVTQGLKNAVPIAVVPFADRSQSGLGEIPAIIRADLLRSGMFKPLAPEELLSRPATADAIIYRDFRVLGVPYLVIGQITGGVNGSYQVHYELYDSNQQKLILGQTYTATLEQLRDVAHIIADKIFEQLTGIPGVFNTKILYVTFNKADAWPYQLQYADADGARARTVLRSKQPIMSPAWAPDAKTIAYVSFEEGGRSSIYLHTLASGQRRLLSRFGGINGAPAFSPDGRKLALTLSKDGNTEIYVMDIASGGLTRVTNNPAIDTEPAWMPDSKSLLFTSSRGGGPQIYRVALGDLSVSRVTFNGDYNARPSVTPDGRFLVYVHREAGNFRIAVQDLQRGTFNVVTQSKLDESPSIAPNGSMVLYGTVYQGRRVLEEVSTDGRVKVSLPAKEGDVRDPAWSPYL